MDASAIIQNAKVKNVKAAKVHAKLRQVSGGVLRGLDTSTTGLQGRRY